MDSVTNNNRSLKNLIFVPNSFHYRIITEPRNYLFMSSALSYTHDYLCIGHSEKNYKSNYTGMYEFYVDGSFKRC